jgi:hypothetical protein
MKPELKESELIIHIENKMNTSQDIIPTTNQYTNVKNLYVSKTNSTNLPSLSHQYKN